MKKSYIYILLMALAGLSLTTACDNDKEFYDYTKVDKTNPDDEPYTVKMAVKMNAEDLARISEMEGTLSGIMVYTPPKTSETRADEQKKNSVDFKFTKGADGFEASVLIMGVDKSAEQVLTATLKHANGNVSFFTTDMTGQLADLNHHEATAPIELGEQEITLPGGADDAIGGGSLNDWDESTDVDGEAGGEINSANE